MSYVLRLILTVLLFKQITMACPSHCICKWKGGKQTVECVNKSLVTIPDGIDAGTQVLDFSGNNLKLLLNDRFQMLDLLNLQKIYMSRCRITVINDGAFKGLTNLVELDLSNNILPAIPTKTFNDYPSLMKLSLNGNPIKTVKSYSFRPLIYLVSLELSRCGIETIEKDAFSGLVALEWLKLDHNLITYIPGVYTLPGKLHGIDLHQNPWECDCNLYDFYLWLNGTKISKTSEPVCQGPLRLRGAPVAMLDENELACLPVVTPNSLYLEISEGKNLTLICRVNAIPEATVSWWFRDHTLQNDTLIAPGLHLYYYIEEGTIEKVSALHILNANVEDNGTFVCVAENQAGRVRSNFTVRIVLRQEPIPMHSQKMPFEYIIGATVAAISVAVFSTIVLIVCILRYRTKKKTRRKRHNNPENESSVLSIPTSRNLDSISETLDGIEIKLNGRIPEAGCNNSLVYSKDGVVTSPIPLTMPSVQMNSAISLEQNPDLISGAVSSTKLQKEGMCSNQAVVEELNNGLFLVSNEYNSISERGIECGVAISQCQDNRMGRVPTDTNQMSARSTLSNVCLNHFQTRDIPLTSEKFMDVDSYPLDYGLPRVATHYPPLVPATAFYRTLPHRRHNTQNGPIPRLSKDAEFLLQPIQSISYEEYCRIADVRHNVEGYPIESQSYYSYTPRVSFADEIHVIDRQGNSEMTVSKSTTGSAKVQVTNSSVQTSEDLTLPPPTDMPRKSILKPSLSADSSIPSQLRNNTQQPRTLRRSAHSDSPDEGYVGEIVGISEV